VLSYDLSLITIHISDYRQFSDIHISQGSVATYVRCRGIFKYQFVANLPLSLPVQEFWKSVNIWESYGQEFSVLFFDSRCLRPLLFLVESTIYSIFNIMAANVVIRECCCIKKHRRITTNFSNCSVVTNSRIGKELYRTTRHRYSAAGMMMLYAGQLGMSVLCGIFLNMRSA